MNSIKIELDWDDGIAKVRAIGDGGTLVKAYIAYSISELETGLSYWNGFLDANGFDHHKTTDAILSWYMSQGLPAALQPIQVPDGLFQCLSCEDHEILAAMLEEGGEQLHSVWSGDIDTLRALNLASLSKRWNIRNQFKILTPLGYIVASLSKNHLMDMGRAYCLCCKRISPIAGVIDFGEGNCRYFCPACQSSGTVAFVQQMAVLR